MTTETEIRIIERNGASIRYLIDESTKDWIFQILETRGSVQLEGA
jgi:hypothetical protein